MPANSSYPDSPNKCLGRQGPRFRAEARPLEPFLAGPLAPAFRLPAPAPGLVYHWAFARPQTQILAGRDLLPLLWRGGLLPNVSSVLPAVTHPHPPADLPLISVSVCPAAR